METTTMLCDGCGRKLEPTGLLAADVVVRLTKEGAAETLHLCHDYEKDDKKEKGCSEKVFTKSAFKYHDEHQEK